MQIGGCVDNDLAMVYGGLAIEECVMNGQIRVAGSAMMQTERVALQCAAEKTLAMCRAGSEILTYELEGWVV